MIKSIQKADKNEPLIKLNNSTDKNKFNCLKIGKYAVSEEEYFV